jgi:hypothetical protein
MYNPPAAGIPPTLLTSRAILALAQYELTDFIAIGGRCLHERLVRLDISDLAPFLISRFGQRFEGNFKAILCSNISIVSDGAE